MLIKPTFWPQTHVWYSSPYGIGQSPSKIYFGRWHWLLGGGISNRTPVSVGPNVFGCSDARGRHDFIVGFFLYVFILDGYCCH